MPFHKTLLPIIAGGVGTLVGGPILGAAAGGLTAGLLGNGAQITPTIPGGQFFQPLPVAQPVAILPDNLVWTAQGFSGSDPAQRALAEKLRQTEQLTPQQIEVLHNSTTKAQFLIDGRRLLLELTSAAAKPALATATRPAVPIFGDTGGGMPPLQVQPSMQAAALPLAFPAIPPAIPIVAGAVGGAAGRLGVVSVFAKIMNALGIAAGLKALISWIRANPGTSAGLAAAGGLTLDQFFDTVAEEAINKTIVLSKSDLKGFRRTVRIAKRLKPFAGPRTRIRKVPCLPACPPACPPRIPAC